jgi:hypothetical protein
LNPRAFEMVQNGVPLFPANRPPMRELKQPPEPVGKIGVVDESYAILGNKSLRTTPATTEDLYQVAQLTATIKSALKSEAELMKECKKKTHTKRQLQELEREVQEMRISSALKEREIEKLRNSLA